MIEEIVISDLGVIGETTLELGPASPSSPARPVPARP